MIDGQKMYVKIVKGAWSQFDKITFFIVKKMSYTHVFKQNNIII